MAMRRVFRCLERPPTEGLSAQDRWEAPVGHSTLFVYSLFGGYWGTWYHLFTSEKGPKEWVFKPFVDEQTMVGEKGRMIYKQHHMPQQAMTGSTWLCPSGSFKRVLSRGGAWENVSPGATHPDERDHDDEQQQKEQRSETEQRLDSPEVPLGTDQPSQGDGDDGEVPPLAVDGEENPSINQQLEDSMLSASNPHMGEGIDGNGSPVV